MNKLTLFFIRIALLVCDWAISKSSKVNIVVDGQGQEAHDWVKRKNLYYITKIIEAKIQIPFSGFESEGLRSSGHREHKNMIAAYNLGVETAIGETKAEMIKILGERYAKEAI